MSYHAIENLVEDAVHLIENSDVLPTDKRNLFFNLYRFQNYFDTGYTVLRCYEILIKNNFIQKLPIQKHPDFNKHTDYFHSSYFRENEWILSDVTQPEGESVYVLKEHNNVFFIPQFGAKLWERLFPKDDKPNETLITEMFLKLMGISLKAGNELLTKNLYLALVNGFLENDLSYNEGFHQNFKDWLTDETLLKIREIFTANNLLKITKKQTDFEIPKLRRELELAYEERIPKVRFLLDSKNSLEVIKADFDKNLASDKNSDWRMSFCPEELEKNGWSLWKTETEKASSINSMIFYKVIKDRANLLPHQLYAEIEFDKELKGIACHLLFQHGLLSEWQDIRSNSGRLNYHFKQDLYNILADSDYDIPDRKFNNFGLWRFDWNASEKTIAIKLKELVDLMMVSETVYIDKIHRYFPFHFFSKSAEEYVQLFEEMIYAPKDLIVFDLKAILLLLIYKAYIESDFDKAESIIKTFEERLPPQFKEKNQWYNEEIAPFFKAIKEKKKALLPNLYR